MKWLYLLLSVAAAFFGILFAIVADEAEKKKSLPVFVSAFVVNLGLFYAHHWSAKKKLSASAKK